MNISISREIVLRMLEDHTNGTSSMINHDGIMYATRADGYVGITVFSKEDRGHIRGHLEGAKHDKNLISLSKYIHSSPSSPYEIAPNYPIMTLAISPDLNEISFMRFRGSLIARSFANVDDDVSGLAFEYAPNKEPPFSVQDKMNITLACGGWFFSDFPEIDNIVVMNEDFVRFKSVALELTGMLAKRNTGLNIDNDHYSSFCKRVGLDSSLEEHVIVFNNQLLQLKRVNPAIVQASAVNEYKRINVKFD